MATKNSRNGFVRPSAEAQAKALGLTDQVMTSDNDPLHPLNSIDAS